MVAPLLRDERSPTGITACLENGGTIENAQAIAAHESPRTMRLYDRRDKKITRNIVKNIDLRFTGLLRYVRFNSSGISGGNSRAEGYVG